jgi:hypothetical protein
MAQVWVRSMTKFIRPDWCLLVEVKEEDSLGVDK